MRTIRVFFLFLLAFTLCVGLSLISAGSRLASIAFAQDPSAQSKPAPPAAGDNSDDHSKSLDPATVRKEVDAYITDLMKSQRIPGLIVGIIQNGKIIMRQGYGTDPQFHGKSVDVNTVFAMGATSEAITGLGAMTLVDQGKLTLSDPVGKYLPKLPPKWQPITIEEFLSRRSGIPKIPWGTDSFQASVKEAANLPFRFPPGSKRAAIGSEYDVIGQVIEAASHEDYMKFMSHEVFHPLKMSVVGDLTLLTRNQRKVDTRLQEQTNLNRDLNGVSSGTTDLHSTTDSWAQDMMIQNIVQSVPEFSIPSGGLSGTMEDLLKFSMAIIAGPLKTPEVNKTFYSLGPGWQACHTSEDNLLSTGGVISGSNGIIVDVSPSRKSGVIMIWYLPVEPKSGPEIKVAQEILEDEFDLPDGGWICH